MCKGDALRNVHCVSHCQYCNVRYDENGGLALDSTPKRPTNYK